MILLYILYETGYRLHFPYTVQATLPHSHTPGFLRQISRGGMLASASAAASAAAACIMDRRAYNLSMTLIQC